MEHLETVWQQPDEEVRGGRSTSRIPRSWRGSPSTAPFAAPSNLASRRPSAAGVTSAIKLSYGSSELDASALLISLVCPSPATHPIRRALEICSARSSIRSRSLSKSVRRSTRIDNALRRRERNCSRPPVMSITWAIGCAGGILSPSRLTRSLQLSNCLWSPDGKSASEGAPSANTASCSSSSRLKYSRLCNSSASQRTIV
jgi:hypothetical protein